VSRVFLDTNVLAYQFDSGEPEKQESAHRLLDDSAHVFVVSTQVLLELFVVITRKLQPAVPPAEAHQVVTTLARLPVVAADARLVLKATSTSVLHQLSVWDAMIVEAAAEAGCAELWTEDLAAGVELRGMTIVNPLTG